MQEAQMDWSVIDLYKAPGCLECEVQLIEDNAEENDKEDSHARYISHDGDNSSAVRRVRAKRGYRTAAECIGKTNFTGGYY